MSSTSAAATAAPSATSSQTATGAPAPSATAEAAPADCALLSSALPSLSLGASCCGVQGIACRGGSVRAVNLTSRGIQGPVLDSLFNLTGIESIDVSQNPLSAQLPSTTPPPSLAVLAVSNCSLLGQLPDWVSADSTKLTNISFNLNPNLGGRLTRTYPSCNGTGTFVACFETPVCRACDLDYIVTGYDFSSVLRYALSGVGLFAIISFLFILNAKYARDRHNAAAAGGRAFGETQTGPSLDDVVVPLPVYSETPYDIALTNVQAGGQQATPPQQQQQQQQQPEMPHQQRALQPELQHKQSTPPLPQSPAAPASSTATASLSVNASRPPTPTEMPPSYDIALTSPVVATSPGLPLHAGDTGRPPAPHSSA
ncbi:hypothetical protein HK105_204773 [Polyrhizophydium stewartii]|uniref:Uncharacterized protein n=1 Tax=Polyrhizophydium stewartii TaxID=2732419 RepID=A0ABR4N7T7_9FUNG